MIFLGFTKGVEFMARLLQIVLFLLVPLTTPLTTQAFSIDWKGLYRFEFVELDNVDINSTGGSKSYGLHHLILRPHIIAADGIELHGQFNLVNSLEYPTSAVGGFFGNGLGSTDSTDNTDSNVLSQRMAFANLAVNELYISWTGDYSTLTVGRAPLNFGLGMMFSDGHGEFDHWFDNRDLFSYKMVSGNIDYGFMLAKVNEGNSGVEDDVTDYIFNVNYNNKDAALKMGLFYQSRVASAPGNDAPRDSLGSEGTPLEDKMILTGWKTEDINFFVGRNYENSHFAIELGLQKGTTGVESAGENIELQGLGVSTEWAYQVPNSRWHWEIKSGYASGDDPNTEAYEGYIFDRNYDVAMLLFNHSLGEANVFRSSVDRNSTKASSNRVDDQALSNVIYFSPRATWKWSETLSLRGTFTYGKLLKESLSNSEASLDLGYEFDVALVSQIHRNFKWVTEVGFVIPGDSFKSEMSENSELKLVYGFITKAAINF